MFYFAEDPGDNRTLLVDRWALSVLPFNTVYRVAQEKRPEHSHSL